MANGEIQWGGFIVMAIVIAGYLAAHCVSTARSRRRSRRSRGFRSMKSPAQMQRERVGFARR